MDILKDETALLFRDKMQEARDNIEGAYNAISVVLENNTIGNEDYSSKMIETMEEMRLNLRKMYNKL